MYKIIFCDLDGTLYNAKEEISDYNIEIIKKIRAKGIHFVPCTGRHFSAWDTIEHDSGIRFGSIIANNGSMIYRGGQPVYLKALSNEYIYKTVEIAKKMQINFNLCTDSYAYRYDYTASQFVLKKRYDPGTTTADMSQIEDVMKNRAIYKIGLSSKDLRLVNTVREMIYEACNNDVDIVSSVPTLLEVGYKGISKGTAILKYCELLGVDVKDTIGIGDSLNDIEMLKTVGLSCCPKGALKLIEEMVDYVSPCDNNRAVGEILEHFCGD